MDAAIERHGQIGILVNNTGVAWSGPAEDEDIEWSRLRLGGIS